MREDLQILIEEIDEWLACDDATLAGCVLNRGALLYQRKLLSEQLHGRG